MALFALEDAELDAAFQSRDDLCENRDRLN